MNNILLIEDDTSIRELTVYDLEHAGYNVVSAVDGLDGLSKLSENKIDVIVVDLMMPKMNGFEFCEKIRETRKDIYIIVLTALDDEITKLKMFDLGADDYISKPFSTRELVARIKVALKRTYNFNNVAYIFKGLTLDTSKYIAIANDKELELTLKEFELLVYLIKYKNTAVSRDKLLTKLWGFSYDGDTRIVDVHIHKLRTKLDDTNIIIKTKRGIGYMIEE